MWSIKGMRIKFQTKNARCLCKLYIVLSAMLTASLAWATTNEVVSQLRFNYAALEASQEDYRLQREAMTLVGEEAADYARYIAGLQRRVFEDCATLVRSGSSFPADLPCPVIVPPVTQSADITTQDEQTPDEQIAAMDAMLAEGLGAYDERLLREQERIKAATPNNNSDSGGGEGGEGEGDGSDSASEGNGTEGGDQNEGDASEGNSETADGDGQPATGPVNSSPGAGAPGSDQDQPSDIPDGSDDDIVARQLREAAENETDPELKAKLWDEYRRYKQGIN